MKLKNASISIFINESHTNIELHDGDAAVTFIKIKLTPEQLSQALGRLSHTECEMETYDLSVVGKKMEHKTIEFEIPMDCGYGEDRRKIAMEYAQKVCPKGWHSEDYFGSQGSFFSKDGKNYARCTIRRWV
jgi:hypothetical protein